MEFTDINQFLTYLKSIRKRTLRVIDYIPEDKIEWTYKEGKFTIGDLIRHIATIERYMYAEAAQFKSSKYSGCGEEFASGYQETVDFLNQMHEESLEIFSKLSPEDLQKKCTTPAGTPITLWKWLRAMIEHEVHHRGQIYLYLSLLGVKTPPLYGLTAEQVIEGSEPIK